MFRKLEGQHSAHGSHCLLASGWHVHKPGICPSLELPAVLQLRISSCLVSIFLTRLLAKQRCQIHTCARQYSISQAWSWRHEEKSQKRWKQRFKGGCLVSPCLLSAPQGQHTKATLPYFSVHLDVSLVLFVPRSPAG